MKLTETFKKWLRDNREVKDGSTDEDYKKAASEALVNESLSTEEYVKLTTTPEEKEASEFSRTLAEMSKGLSDLTELLKASNTPSPPQEKDSSEEEETPEETPSTKTTPTEVKGKPLTGLAKHFNRLQEEPEDDEKGFEVRVKEAAEMYSTTKGALRYPEISKNGRPHPLAGQPVTDYSAGGKTLDEGSELDMAICGSYAKFLCATRQRGGSRNLGFSALPQHDKELLGFALTKMRWNGASDGGDYADIRGRQLTPNEQKAVIDDATSGGLEAAPIVFDDMVIQTPLLHGELFPLVATKDIPRGRRVEGVSTGTVTGSWGGVDDTAVTLFTTTSYISAFDTTIFRWEGAIRIGLDFLSDTPIDFGAHITEQYGERLLEDLDDVVAVGNGTTQPEGVINKTGATSVNFGAATSIGNYESLRFGVAKAEHKANLASSAVFCGTETSYQRVKALSVGSADARRLFAGASTNTGTYDDYAIMGRPYKINESLSNQQLFYAILGRYRMYRRRGLTMRTSTEGDTLIRNNEMLMVAMARYGGQLERGGAGAITTTAPS